MKRLISITLLIALVFTLMAPAAYAADAITANVTSVDAIPGETVTLTVSLSGLKEGYVSGKLILNYPAELTLVSIIGVGFNGVENLDQSLINHASSDPVDEATLATVAFKVADDAAAGNYTVTATVKDMANCDFAVMPVSDGSGTVTVTIPECETHTWGNWVGTAADCENAADRTRECSVCGKVETDNTAALGHDWDDGVVTIEPTEDAEGVKTFTCGRCGETKTESVDKLDHEHKIDTEAGWESDAKGHWHVCDCGESVDYAAHDWDNGVVVEEATEDEAGLMKYTCEVCGYETEVSYELEQEDEFPWWNLIGGVASEPFTDVTSADWFYDDVVYVYNKGLMNGVTNTTFAPDGTTTRAMIVTILWRLDGKAMGGVNTFADVAAGSWYEDAVAWAAKYGIVTGYDAATFGPNDPITREQLATILYRFNNYRGGSLLASDLEFPDAGSVSGYAVEAMKWAVGQNLINGMDGKLNPKGYATRAQVAAILTRYCK